MFWYLTLMILFLHFLLNFCFNWEDISNSKDHISKHLKIRQKYTATSYIFNSLLGVWKSGETRSSKYTETNLFINEPHTNESFECASWKQRQLLITILLNMRENRAAINVTNLRVHRLRNAKAKKTKKGQEVIYNSCYIPAQKSTNKLFRVETKM